MSASGSGGALWVRARQLLAAHRGDRSLSGAEWLEIAHEAHAFAVSTFPEERRGRALKGFVERHCGEQAPRTIAVYALALRLLGEKRLRGEFGQFGACLEAAALACGTTADEIPLPRTPPAADATSVASQREAAPRSSTKVGGLEYWN